MSAIRLLPLGIVLLLSSTAFAQSLPNAPGVLPNAPGAPPIAPAPAINPGAVNATDDSAGTPTVPDRPAPPALQDYLSCTFDDGLQIVRTDALPPGPQERTVNTLEGKRTIHMLDGRRLMLAYGVSGDYFANVKPEILPADTWATQKGYLLDEIQALQRSDFTMRPNTSLPPTLHGLEIHGFDRSNLDGRTLGFYLLFDNQQHIATSIYLLNQDPLARRFHTMTQYFDLRSHFLDAYTACVQQNRELRDPAAARAQP